ncbi:hypothetical protein NAT51_04190 [Flavobacterium amniphilum]|uniref:hypothetical protein n=1 Tax=Flavobacterium amniphilum TaxID=1834035 RepID=UPI002029EF1D|nr:hypothetical protein [Flavobacterium amniphilum]MCL9804708.1 hypothetical protein [Flavobacterium amniphilum]
MDRLKLTLNILMALVLTPAFPQLSTTNEQNTPFSEKVHISTNSNTLLTGEKLYYTITCLNKTGNSFSTLSKIAYVELISSDKEMVYKTKLVLNNSKSNGEYFIPASLKTGNYKLVAYTNWMLNTVPLELDMADISIINPYQIPDNKKVQILNNAQANSQSNSSINTLYGFDKKKYAKREKLTLKANGSATIDKYGSYALKVQRKDSLNPSAGTKLITTQSIGKKANLNITPEFRGEMLKGKIKARKNPDAELKNVNISLSIVGNRSFIKIVKTDYEGKFCFTIESPVEKGKVHIQILDKEINEYTIEMEDSPAVLDYTNLTFTPVSISASMKKMLENRAVASQIENAYIALKKDSLTEDKTVKNEQLKFDITYNLDDYTRFKTLKETLTEIIDRAHYKSVGKKFEIHITDNIEEYELSYPALVLIDGYYIQDVTELFNYNVDNVKSVSLIKGGYYLGTKIFNGVIFIKTKNNDYESTNKEVYVIEPTLLRPLQKKEIFNIDYTTKDYSRIPDYRYQLLWKPDLNPEEKEISFYTSDISGTFEVILEGIDSKGNPVYLSDSFEVE